MTNLATKEDIKGTQKTLERQEKDIEAVQSRLDSFENRMERLEKRSKACNLRFSNVSIASTAEAAAMDTCFGALKINPSSITIKRAVVLKRFDAGKGTILVEFVDQSMVSLVFKHIKNLDGTRIGMEKDLTEGEISIKSSLYALREELLKANGALKIYVNDTTIKIGSNFFSVRNHNLLPRNTSLDIVKFFNENFNFNINNFMDKYL